MKQLFGVITAMTTPFDGADHVDVKALEQQTEFLIGKGVNCLYPCGTTGEMYLLSAEERELVAETVVKKAAGRVTVFIQTGAMTEGETIRLSKHAKAIGADGIGVVTPSYFTVDERAMIQYYKDISGAVPDDFPVYTYVIPQLAHNDITPGTMEKIAKECKNIIGVKYSYADMTRFSEYLGVNDRNFSAVFGPDHLFLPALSIGGAGTVSGCSGPVPEVFVDIYKKFLSGDMEGAKAAQVRALKVCNLLRNGGDLSIFKGVLSARGIPGGSVRKPLLNIDQKELGVILKALEPYFS
jgi:4-hydroxy-tetrahydrodipicolinate synthase